MPKGILIKFVVAGKLKNGKLAVGDILANDEGADLEIYEGEDIPSTIIFPPDDMNDLECNMLFQKATKETIIKNNDHKDIMETIHRKAVEYVSKKSKFVSRTSDYIYIE